MFGAVWTKQGTWMLFGTESSGCKNKILLPLLTSGDFQGSHDQVIDELNLHYSRWISDVASTGIKLLKTPYHAPRANAVCERFLRSVRRECLDHLLILHEKQLHRMLNAYVAYFNQARPHQGIIQQIPEQRSWGPSAQDAGKKVIALPVMGGLHHDYHWAA